MLSRGRRDRDRMVVGFKMTYAICAYHRAPDKLRICVFYAMKTRKTHVLSDQSVHITHTYCCVSKLSKFGVYLYSRVHNNTFLSLRNSP